MKNNFAFSALCIVASLFVSCGSSHNGSDTDTDNDSSVTSHYEKPVLSLPESVKSAEYITILVGSDPVVNRNDTTEIKGKIFIALNGGDDIDMSTEQLRSMVLDKAIEIYNGSHSDSPIAMSSQMRQAFIDTDVVGIPFSLFNKFYNLSVADRDKALADVSGRELQTLTDDPRASVGIPIDDNKDIDAHLNELQIWMLAVRQVAEEIHNKQHADPMPENEDDHKDFYTAVVKDGTGIAIGADTDVSYSLMQQIFDNIQTVGLNKFSLKTTLKEG